MARRMVKDVTVETTVYYYALKVMNHTTPHGTEHDSQQHLTMGYPGRALITNMCNGHVLLTTWAVLIALVGSMAGYE
jgi:hypothetical protein